MPTVACLLVTQWWLYCQVTYELGPSIHSADAHEGEHGGPKVLKVGVRVQVGSARAAPA